MNYQVIATWSQVVSAVLFIAALVWLWIRFIQPAVLAAQEAQNARIAEAERHRDEAKAALARLHDEIDAVVRNAAAMKDRVRAQLAIENQTLLREAREAGERALKDAQEELPRVRAAARQRLRDELVEAALATARGEAERRLDAGINRKVVASFTRSLEGGR